jgi:tetratricopeptide (TPR) repeat protein
VDLIGPVEDVIKHARHLVIVPAGPLTSLPFHLLVTEKPATPIPQLKDIASYRDAAWLIKRQAASVLPALASLKALRQVARRDPGAKPMVGFGDPVFDPPERARALAARRTSRIRVAVTRGYGDFWQGANIDRVKLARYLPSLLDTADELKAVAKKLGAAAGDIHLGSDASETVVKRTALNNYRVVYFATHGLVAGDVGGLAEPSLALTLPNQPTELDDGLLTASEVAQLNLNADWVVLSACNTAAADKPGAEALSGLARAFFYAGARALLVSHWSVDSEAATRLTTSTFAVMKSDPKVGRAAALRNAMLAYMNDNSSPLNAYPAFWGPFSIIGEGAESATPAVGPASQSEQTEQTCTAQMPSSQIPDVPQRVAARVMDTVPTGEVLATTGDVESQIGAKISPAYLAWLRVLARMSPSGQRTIAAIPPDMTVEVGDLVELNLRYRDHSLPCHFIPVTINRVIEHGKLDYGQAIADYDQAIELSPKDANAYVRRGEAYLGKGDHNRAIADFEEAIRLYPKNAKAYNDRGFVYWRQHDLDRAITDYDQAITLNPKSEAFYSNRGAAYNDKGDYDLAIADLDQAIQLNPNFANGYSHRGYAYGGKGEYARAMADLNKALALNPKYSRGYSNRAAIHELHGDLDQAIADADEAIRLDPKDALAYSWRGKAHFDKKQYALAMIDLEQALRLDPLLSEASQNHERAKAALATPPQ